MKILMKSLTVATIITIIFSMIPFSATCKNVSNQVFRLHILANSDSEADQNLKLKVRDAVLEYTESMYKSSDTLQKAEALTAENLQDIANVAQAQVYKSGYNYKVKAQIAKMYFNTRYYDKVTMPSGQYYALRITIGSGEGHNWWCVMYPSLCVGASTDYNSLKEKTSEEEYDLLTKTQYQYKFKVVEIFEKICSFFA
jgi:stage II sporulation protein R